MNTIITYLIARGRERSTWLGLIGLLASVGVSLQPQLQEAIISIGIGAASLIAMLTADTPPDAR
jgi:hypothetical protein